MIKTLIFDFGDVFINLDKQGAMKNALELFELDTFSEEMQAFNTFYEQGLISTEEFVEFYLENFPKCSKKDILNTWNCILKEFPKHRLEFIQKLALSKQYQLILLSNTNELHINWIKKHIAFYEDFKACFDAFYLSHEIQLRKPDKNIFEFVLNTHHLKAQDVLFIDDTLDNVEAASKLGIHTWHINPKTEDISDLFNTKKLRF